MTGTTMMHRGGHYLRHKIGARIAERRNRGQKSNSPEDVASPRTGRTASYSVSQLPRQTSESGFFLVEDEAPRSMRSQSLQECGGQICSGGGSGEAEEEDDQDLADAHISQEQQQESEDNISYGDLEKLDMSDEDDEPRPKPSGASADGLGLDGIKEVKEKKLWEITDTEVYEQQLMMLQEQLTSALIENQSLQSKFIKYVYKVIY